MEKMILGQLAAFNQIYKEMDEIYHSYARRHGISDAALWLLYSLCEGGADTQGEICAVWHYPPQTVNSVLKNLERQGFIALEPVQGNRKNKRIVLTEQGTALAERVIRPLILAEQRALHGMEEKERDSLLDLTQKYVDFLQAEVDMNE